MVRLFLTLLVTTTLLAQSPDESYYSGSFAVADFSTDLHLKVIRTDNETKVFFSSLQQNALEIPAKTIKATDDSLFFDLRSDRYHYQFRTALTQSAMNGELAIEGRSYPISLQSTDQLITEAFAKKDVRLKSGNLYLYGSIYYPRNPNGRAIYFVNSSGNSDRSASRAEAIFLSHQGFITFHTDKRGTGISDGNWQNASIRDLCMDDMKAIEFLSESERMPLEKIGIKGSSQGASKIPYILEKMPQVGFAVMVSCPGATLLESDLNHWKNNTRDQLSDAEHKKATSLQGSIYHYIAGNRSRREVNRQIEANRNESWINTVWIPDLKEVDQDEKLNYSPIPHLAAIQQPLLLIQGENDKVIPANSLELLEYHLPKNVADRITFLRIPNADHSLMVQNTEFPYWPILHKDYYPQLTKWLTNTDLP